MRNNLYLLFTFCVIYFFVINDGRAQCIQGDVTTFQKSYGSFGSERGHSVVSTTDGGYAFVGETTSSGAGSMDMFVSKIDANGNQQWSFTYGGASLDDGNSMSIIQSSDGGYLISGHTISFGGGNNGYLIKLNSTGIVQWDKVTSGTTIRHLQELSNGDFAVTGNAYTFGPGIIASYVMRMTPLGAVLWSKGYGGAQVDQATCVMETPNGDMIITSHSNGFGVGGTDGTLLRIDNVGTIVWGKYYGGAVTEAYYATSMLSDGNMIAVGLTNSYGVGGEDVLLSKIDLNGNIIWTRTFGGGGIDRGEHALENLNGEIIISGYSNSFGGGFDMLLFSTDLNGNLIWSKTYGGAGTDEIDRWSKPFDIAQDNGMVLVGGTNSFGVGSEDIYLVKTNECGESFCNDLNVNLLTTSPNIAVGNAAITSGSGGGYPPLNTLSTPTNYTTTTMCIDSITLCNIIPSFVSANVCIGDSSAFFDTSVDNIGNIINWKWYFGDGDSTIGVQNPVHLYGTSGNYTTTLVLIDDSNCVDSVSITISVNPVQQQNVNVAICQGDSLFLGGEFQQVAGIYVDTLTTSSSCDSIVISTLIVNPLYNLNQIQSICQGDSILLGGSYQTLSGSFTDTLLTIFGCDSVVNTDLTINPSYFSSQSQIICQGDSFLFGGIYYSFTGIYHDSLLTVLGCDSILELNLIVNNSYQLNQVQNICQGDSIMLAGNFQNTAGTYTDSLQTILGCDSIITYTLFVNPIYNINRNQMICQGESLFLGGSYQTNPGIYIDVFQSINSCDSVVITNLTVNPTPIIIAFSDTTIEEGDIVQLSASGGSTYVWSPDFDLSCANCQYPLASPTQTTTYFVEGYDNGCFSSDTIVITVKKTELSLYIPNSFTPNFDNENDVFYFYAYGFKEFEAQIFNRWGELLYESTNILEGWNAIYKGEDVPLGIYVYKVKLVSFDNQYFRKVGSINVIR